jgi:hypothetical protein
MDMLSQQYAQEPGLVWPPLNVTMLDNGFWMLPELPVVSFHNLFPELPAHFFSQATIPAEPVMAN